MIQTLYCCSLVVRMWQMKISKEFSPTHPDHQNDDDHMMMRMVLKQVIFSPSISPSINPSIQAYFSCSSFLCCCWWLKKSVWGWGEQALNQNVIISFFHLIIVVVGCLVVNIQQKVRLMISNGVQVGKFANHLKIPGNFLSLSLSLYPIQLSHQTHTHI